MLICILHMLNLNLRCIFKKLYAEWCITFSNLQHKMCSHKNDEAS